MKILLIDDKRSFRVLDDEKVLFISYNSTFTCNVKDEVTIARTCKKGLRLLEEETWDVLLLDNDLGSDQEEGHNILTHMEIQKALHPGYYLPDQIIPVTANLVAFTRMETIIKRLYNGHRWKTD